MIEVTVITEGQTEEGFIKQVIAPSVRHLNIFVKPQTLRTSKDSCGGAVTYDRFKYNARNTLRQKPDGILTTFIDLYALDTDFPRFAEANDKANVYQKVNHLEESLHHDIVSCIGCRPERFRPHIQPYEFEGILFSDSELLVSTEPEWVHFKLQIENVKNQFESPEHINDGYETKPSSRLGRILRPTYKKTRHGPIAAKRIGLDVIERECAHFHDWMEWLRRLAE